MPANQETVDLTPDEMGQKAAAESSLYEFIKQAWAIIEPTTPFIDGRHIEVICLHLEAVAAGKIRNLIINVPPGCCKSTTISVCWPAWSWIQNPATRWLSASYSGVLSMRDARRTREVIESPWYQKFWGERFTLDNDQNSKKNFLNSATGWRIATSVEGQGTGEHPDYVIVDDAQNAKESGSDTERRAVNDWWDGTISSRGKTKKICRVVVGQRLHENDLTGHILERADGDWEHICLPMRAEAGAKASSLGWIDDRRLGELLWPAAMPEQVVKTIEREMGPFKSAGQLQQRPVPEGGGLFHRDWFEVIPAALLPDHWPRVRFWDCAASTTNQADYTAGVKMVRKPDGVFIVENIIHGRFSPGARDNLVQQTAQVDGVGVPIYVEEEPGAGGKSLIDHYVRMLPGWAVRGERHAASKVARAQPLAGYSQNGLLKIMQGQHVQTLLDEIGVFPNGRHDDLIDATCAAFNILAKHADHASHLRRELLTSGDPDHDDRTPLTHDELEQAPEFLKELLVEYRKDARRSDDFDDDERRYGRR